MLNTVVGQTMSTPDRRKMDIQNTVTPRISRADDDRRATLKAFLTHCRSRLKPEDVGLPQTHRRRVDGLRREEVAELAGVSADWYRWFEAGRTMRVSVGFLARLSDALRLKPAERISLFCLALPEVYEAYASEPQLTAPLQLAL
jgi:Helix-turn-helix domain